MKYKNYCHALTKQYIKDYYHIYYDDALDQFKSTKTNEIRKKILNNSGHYVLEVYDCYLKEQKTIGFHRLKYAWYHDIPEGLVVDHINNCKVDNRLSNLQLLTQRENVLKSITSCKPMPLPSHGNPSAEKYISKLEKYVKRYKEEIANGDQEAIHKTRSCIHLQKAKLLNYMSEEEYQALYKKFIEG